MDSEGSPRRQRIYMSVHRFRVPHRIFLAPTKIQGGKTNEQKRKSYGCSPDCRKGSHP